jgi:hypothetical protein
VRQCLHKASTVLDEAKLYKAGRKVRRSRLVKVGQIDAAAGNAALAAGLRSPKAVIRKTGGQVVKGDLGTEFRRETRKPIGTATRANAARDPDDDKGIEGETIASVHAELFPLCSRPSSSECTEFDRKTPHGGGHHDAAADKQKRPEGL